MKGILQILENLSLFQSFLNAFFIFSLYAFRFIAFRRKPLLHFIRFRA